MEKRQKKLKKKLFTELRGDDGHSAIFFSLAKIAAARELQVQKEREIEDLEPRKCNASLRSNNRRKNKQRHDVSQR